ncbi:hypothetical protein EUTSA_v10028226mg [Eutrema salsugineum]|uniref:Uncharacterized protein n=1 Tax=Eutrema salsugineum TaxID=72664 RepID=V4L9N2_EUTSA|nr:uncharacterized protein LOC18022612 [Eutrema salsugineum]ESQ47110.1 hypothetical protein EUTSA_v10028226mg [Eutrema salsugineum]
MDQETKPGYEPDRIPPSVFATTMTPKQEWSMQSNESLFSIHMGDQSFSKMYKSGELSNFEYTGGSYIGSSNNNNIDNKITLTDAGTKEVKIHVDETGPKAGNRDVLTNVSKPDPPQQIPLTPTKSYRSDTSNNSAASFAFPTLPEYQQDRKISLKVKSENRKTEISRHDLKPGLYPNDPKPGNGGSWLSCFSCFPVKKLR